MAIIRHRQPVITRLFPHNGNRRFIVPSRKAGNSKIPDYAANRQPREIALLNVAAGQGGIIQTPRGVDVNKQNIIKVQFASSGAVGSYRTIFYSGTAGNNSISLAIGSNGSLQAAINGSVISTPANLIKDKLGKFFDVQIVLSVYSETTMHCQMQVSAPDVDVTYSGNYPKSGLAPGANCWLAGANFGAVDFFGVIRNFIWRDASGDTVYLLDNNATALPNVGTTTDGNATYYPRSGSAWQDQSASVDYLALSGDVDCDGVTVGSFDIFNDGTAIDNWSLVHSVAGLLTVTEIIATSPSVFDVRCVPVPIAPGDTVTVTYNRDPLQTTDKNAIRFSRVLTK